jgi:hypothetical protein
MLSRPSAALTSSLLSAPGRSCTLITRRPALQQSRVLHLLVREHEEGRACQSLLLQQLLELGLAVAETSRVGAIYNPNLRRRVTG